METIDLAYKDHGTVKMLNYQKLSPYYCCSGVDDLLRVYPRETTKIMACSMFMLGYIEGKRAERARRQRGTKQ